MGNRCGLSGSGLTKTRTTPTASAGTWRGWLNLIRLGGAALVLILAAFAILGFSFRPASPQKAAQISASSLTLGNSPQSRQHAEALLSHLPLIFEPNQGQTDSSVKFLSRGQDYSLYLDQTDAVLALQTVKPASVGNQAERGVEALRMKLAGANRAAEISGSDRLAGASNYFIGNDPKQWHKGIPHFAGVRYRSVYPGIDLVFYGSQGRLEYDFKVAPGADPSQAQLQFDGASKLNFDHGDLILRGTTAKVRLQAPRIYQQIGNRQQEVEGHFVLRAENRVGFQVGSYDRSRELVIDPIISYSTYFGGSATTTLPYIAVNGNSQIYLTGSTTSPNLPVVNAYQSGLVGAQNIFILQLDPTLAAAGAVYLTYLGGSGTDAAAGIGVDNAGNAYVAGTTSSANFPVLNGFQSGPKAGSTGASHVFVSEIGQNGGSAATLLYSTYLSGSGTDIASGMAIDNNRDVFVTGTTTSLSTSDVGSGFPSTQLPVPFQENPSPGSTIQFFVTEVNTATIGTVSVPYSTYFGGAVPADSTTVAIGGGITVDTTGNVYFSGTTNFFNSGEGTNGVGGLQNTDFPILNAYQPCLDTPPLTTILPPITCTAPTAPYPTDAFVAKLNPTNAQTSAQQLLFSTYFGGSSDDSSPAVAIDSSSVYITGTTDSSDFVEATGIAPFQMCLDTPVNPSSCTAITPPAPTDAYVAKFSNPAQTSGTGSTQVVLSYFSYLGGTGNDSGLSIATDNAGGALITGATSSTDFPVTPGALQSTLNGAQNAYFASINTGTSLGTSNGNTATYFGGNGTDRGTSVAVDPSLNIYLAGDTTSTNLQVQSPLQATLQGTIDAFAVKLQTASNLCIGGTGCIPPVISPSSGSQGAGNPISFTYTLENQGPDLATNVIVTAQLSSGSVATFGTDSSIGSGTCSAPSGNNVVCTIPSLQSGSTSLVTFSVTPTTAGNGSITVTVTYPNNTNPAHSITTPFTATDYSVSISPASQTVVAGDTATYAVLISPSQSFGNNVSLSCSSTLPTGASCGFNPSTLTFSGPGALAATLSLTTTERPPVVISSTGERGIPYAFWVIAPGMALIGAGAGKKRRSRILGGFALFIVFAFFALQPACSKTKQQQQVTGTPAGTYSLNVTATSGSFTKSQGFSLTVQ
jgi:uncharacterized repeat protein (TIGR01451 family)